MNLDDDNVNTLLRNVRKHNGGGHGEIISFKAEMNLHLTVFFVCHKNRISLSVDYSDITVPNIFALKKQRELGSAKETNTEALTINLKDISKTYETMI